jgi:redox-sensitive bicupin YhaK (pirin superfamily)
VTAPSKTVSRSEPAIVARGVERIIEGVATSDGAGVRLLRVLGAELQRRLDPFLLLDEFRSDDPRDYIAGFPNHPHRGFETVTYMLAGRMRHRDNAGHEGLLTAGSVQWMTAGRGIVHSELPEQENGLMQGFQLWVNLPAARKMAPPAYRDIAPAEIPEVRPAVGVAIKVIAGRWEDTPGAVRRDDIDVRYLDVALDAGRNLELPLPPGHNGFVYVYAGAIEVGDDRRRVAARQMAVLDNRADATGVRVAAPEPSRWLLIAGRPLSEPIVQWGPFVMNTREEVEQAIQDFRDGKF